MSFFDDFGEADFSVPRPQPSETPRPTVPWFGPPSGAVGGWVPWRVVLAHTEDTVLFLSDFEAFPTGLRFEMVARIRAGTGRPPERTNTFMLLGMDRGFRFGVEFSDGRKTRANPMDILRPPSETAPATPILRPAGPGGGNIEQSRIGFWLWPLPPAGPLTWILAWDEQGVDETLVTVDASVLPSAAGDSEQR